jgi:DNA-binding CsgD family transcriptional regulator
LQEPGEPGERLAVDEFALRWLQIDPTPRLIVDSGLWLHWRNEAAERLLHDSPDLEARDGQLAAEDRQGNVALADLVTNAANELSTCTLSCVDGDGHLLIQARLLTVSGSGRVALCIQRTGSKYRSGYADFSGAFGLTAAEAEIAGMLISGQTADSIAEQRAGSVGTVRSHIRSIYHKLDVSSREMMFHRLQAFRIL